MSYRNVSQSKECNDPDQQESQQRSFYDLYKINVSPAHVARQP